MRKISLNLFYSISFISSGASATNNTNKSKFGFSYAGPGSHQVDESFDVIWEKYLTSSHNFIIALIDGRGSDLKGQEMMYSIYRRLGTYEIYDQINVTRYLQDKFPYIDANRTAVWGWSYGGYATGLALALDTNNVFKCGISVAPVTDWVLYGKSQSLLSNQLLQT